MSDHLEQWLFPSYIKLDRVCRFCKKDMKLAPWPLELKDKYVSNFFCNHMCLSHFLSFGEHQKHTGENNG